MKKILIVCGNGLGSSFIVEMNIKKIINELNLPATVSHTDISSAKGESADLYLGSRELIAILDDGARNVIGLKNLMDKEELKQALQNGLV